MAEEESEGLAALGSEDGALRDHIAHWMDVLDRWVKRIDMGLGQQDGGAAPEGDVTGDRALLQMDDGDELAKGV